MAKEVLEKHTLLKKEFSYSKGNLSLNFTLSMENSSGLRTFLALLNEAQADVEKAISEMKN